MSRIWLLEDEKVEKVARPHFIGFIDLYLVWIYFIIMSTLLWFYGEQLVSSLSSFSLFSLLIEKVGHQILLCAIRILLFFFVIFIPTIILAFIKINFFWIFLNLILFICILIFSFVPALNVRYIYLFPSVFALICIAFIDIFRASHTFIATNKRLIFVRRFLLFPRMIVESYYKQISNLVVKQTFLESVFQCGTVIPIMTSGLNTGSEILSLSTGFLFMGLTMSKEKKLPRAIPYLCFFSVKHPEEISTYVTQQIINRE